jgi:hypothetical protein
MAKKTPEAKTTSLPVSDNSITPNSGEERLVLNEAFPITINAEMIAPIELISLQGFEVKIAMPKTATASTRSRKFGGNGITKCISDPANSNTPVRKLMLRRNSNEAA